MPWGEITITVQKPDYARIDRVTFGGKSAAYFQSYSNTTIKAFPGFEGASGYIAVYSSAGVDSMPGFTYVMFPSFSSISPNSGGLGTVITIKGKDLPPTHSVFIGQTETEVLSRNDSVVVVKLARPGTGDISFRLGVSSIGTDLYFTYTDPLILDIQPRLVKKGTRISITGAGFGILQQVKFGSLPGLDVVKVNGSKVEATVPIGINNDTVYVVFDNGVVFDFVILVPSPDNKLYTGKKGDTLWITGENLMPSPGIDNILLGNKTARIVGHRPDSIQVIVPTATEYGPITMVNKGKFLTSVPVPFSAQYQPSIPVNKSTFASSDSSGISGKQFEIRAQGDFNNDGNEDFIAYRFDSLFIFQVEGKDGKGNNTFKRIFLQSPASHFINFYITDYNNDGWQDILYTTVFGKIGLFENRGLTTPGTISFISYGSVMSNNQSSKFLHVETGDINGQGSHSVAALDNNGKILLFKNILMPGAVSQFGYQLVESLQALCAFSYFELADLDGDRLPEILAICPYEPKLYIFRNTSSPHTVSFAPPTTFPLPENPRIFTTGDLNIDAKIDIAILFADNTTRSLLLRNVTQSAEHISFTADQDMIHEKFAPTSIRFVTANGDKMPDLLLEGRQGTATNGGTEYLNVYGFIENHSAIQGIIKADTLKTFLMEKSAGVPGQLGVYNNRGERVFLTDHNGDGKPDFMTNYGFVFRNKAGEKPVLYHYRPEKPILSDTIDIVGYNLSGVYDVSFGNSKAIIHFASDTLLRVSLYSYEGGNLKVTNHFGTDSILAPVIIQVPEITGMAPKVIAPGGQVTITGKHFSGTSLVRAKIGNVWVPVLNNTDTTISLTIPPGAISGKLAVLANGLYGFSRDWLLVSEPSGITEVKPNDFLLLDSFYAGRQAPIRSLQITSINGRDKNDLFLKQDSSFKNYYDYTITKNQPVVLERKHGGQKQLYSRIGLPSTAPYYNNDIAWEDLDGNGYPDMFVGIDSDIDNSLLFINKGGDGKLFNNPIQSKDIIWNGPWDFFKSDFDMNGRIDIGYRPGQSYGLSLFINTLWKDSIILRKETFSQYISWYMRYAKPDDIDQDGKTDMAWVQYHANSARQIHFNRNISDSGIFKLSPLTEVVGGEENTTIMDFSMAPIFQENAKNELILIRKMDNSPGGRVDFFKKNPNHIPDYYSPIMEKAFEMPIQYKPLFMKLADVDGDGRLDVVAFLRNPAIETNEQLITHIAVVRNTSQGTEYSMASPVYLTLPARAASVEIADMDEDGKPDILLGGVNGYITVLKNFIGLPKPRIVCPGETVVLNEVPAGASSFQWQVSVDSGQTFSNITTGSFYTGENTGQLTIAGITTSLYGNIYKCVTNTGTLPGTMIKISHSWKTNAPDSLWENAANWSCGSVPEGMTDVVIPAGANVRVNSQASCRSIVVATGATITLQPGAQLNILK